MVRMFTLRNGMWKRVAAVVVIALMCFVGVGYTMTDAEELPHVAKWVNGMAVSSEGAYLADTWAIDDTGVSDAIYVLLGQNCTEEMRVKNYPEDVTEGESALCQKYAVTVFLDLPAGVSGDVIVTLGNEVAEYSAYCLEFEGYSKTIDFYPGVYSVTGVEVLNDANNTYIVTDDVKLDVAKEQAVVLEVASKEGASSDEKVPVDGDGTDKGSSDKGSSGDTGMSDKNKELLADTVKLCIAVVVLLAAYGIIKYRRQKAEEIQE